MPEMVGYGFADDTVGKPYWLTLYKDSQLYYKEDEIKPVEHSITGLPCNYYLDTMFGAMEELVGTNGKPVRAGTFFKPAVDEIQGKVKVTFIKLQSHSHSWITDVEAYNHINGAAYHYGLGQFIFAVAKLGCDTRYNSSTGNIEFLMLPKD